MRLWIIVSTGHSCLLLKKKSNRITTYVAMVFCCDLIHNYLLRWLLLFVKTVQVMDFTAATVVGAGVLQIVSREILIEIHYQKNNDVLKIKCFVRCHCKQESYGTMW